MYSARGTYRPAPPRSRAAFIDRDGNLIHEVGYISNLKRVKFYSRSIKAIKLLKDGGYKVIVVTNQSGVARGYFTESFVKKTHLHINCLLKKYGLKIDGFYYCPHHRTKAVLKRYLKDCDCRKPKTGMIKAAAKKFNIDIKKSVVIGDKLTDVHLGKNAGTKTALVLTGYGKEEKALISKAYDRPDFIGRDFYAAAKWFAALNKRKKP
ncbi:MAG: HAD family hydrolase [Spirochaetia bacterium]|nr:HAD family hydrolase [Spirochaetia bacterium]